MTFRSSGLLHGVPEGPLAEFGPLAPPKHVHVSFLRIRRPGLVLVRFSKLSAKLGSKLDTKLGTQPGIKAVTKLGTKLSTKLFSKLGTWLGIKLSTKLGTKFITKLGVARATPPSSRSTQPGWLGPPTVAVAQTGTTGRGPRRPPTADRVFGL